MPDANFIFFINIIESIAGYGRHRWPVADTVPSSIHMQQKVAATTVKTTNKSYYHYNIFTFVLDFPQVLKGATVAEW